MKERNGPDVAPRVHSVDYDRNFRLIDARSKIHVFNYHRECNDSDVGRE
jgi:hypothetical protein